VEVGRAVAALVGTAIGVALGEGVGVTRVMTCPQPASIRREARDKNSCTVSFGNFKSSSQVAVIGLGQIIPQGGGKAVFLQSEFVHRNHLQYTVKGLEKCVHMELA